jgi:hypothetical protein
MRFAIASIVVVALLTESDMAGVELVLSSLDTIELPSALQAQLCALGSGACRIAPQ